MSSNIELVCWCATLGTWRSPEAAVIGGFGVSYFTRTGCESVHTSRLVLVLGLSAVCTPVSIISFSRLLGFSAKEACTQNN